MGDFWLDFQLPGALKFRIFSRRYRRNLNQDNDLQLPPALKLRAPLKATTTGPRTAGRSAGWHLHDFWPAAQRRTGHDLIISNCISRPKAGEESGSGGASLRKYSPRRRPHHGSMALADYGLNLSVVGGENVA